MSHPVAVEQRYFIDKDEQTRFVCSVLVKGPSYLSSADVNKFVNAGFFNEKSVLCSLYKKLGRPEVIRSIFKGVGFDRLEDYCALVSETADKFKGNEGIFCDFAVFFMNIGDLTKQYFSFEFKSEIFNLINSNVDRAYEIFVKNTANIADSRVKKSFLKEALGDKASLKLDPKELQKIYIDRLKEDLGAALILLQAQI